MDFLIGGLAGAGSSIFINPIDVVKTRLQLQGELRSGSKTATKYKSTFHGLYVIAKTEGLLALQKGLVPAMVLGFLVNALSLGIYSMAEAKGYTKNKNGDVNIKKSMFWSATGGLLGGVGCNPLLVVKIRLQSAGHPSIAVGRQHVYNGLLDGLVKLHKFEGLRGIFAGVTATATRLAIGYSAQLTTFSKAKELLISHGHFKSSPFGLAFVASSVSGIAVVLANCPFDVVATRLYNQGNAPGRKLLYTGILDCLMKIYKIEGLHGLYKGVGPLYIKLAPNVTISLVMWDFLQRLLRSNKTN
ncbi:unnamed protein product [Arctia plantaginis]|uniref:Uncharacterized protein n=1 Tax=Arctia plantaginis TaxID=874455 RepID=A0A8S0YSI1_ARCPL|nr:unnamed protein product [Arctia plantaginis]